MGSSFTGLTTAFLDLHSNTMVAPRHIDLPWIITNGNPVGIVTTGGTPYTFFLHPQCPRSTPAHSANLIPMRYGYVIKTTE
jgi:hypothetical protein